MALLTVQESGCCRKQDLKRPDKTPRNYDNTTFTLDGRIDLDVTCNDQEMCTPVYVKSDVHDQNYYSLKVFAIDTGGCYGE